MSHWTVPIFYLLVISRLSISQAAVFNSAVFEELVEKDFEENVPTKKGKENFSQVRDRFYRTFSHVDPSACEILKSVGGSWGRCHTVDAQKEVCFDPHLDLLGRAARGECLVYSFGVGDDYSFEESMAAMGCRVRAFDPTIKPPDVNPPNVTFHQFALGHTSGRFQLADNLPLVVDFRTLSDTLSHFGDDKKVIDYLKVDVEGHEIPCLSQWTRNGVLDNVRQMELEIHMIASEYGQHEKHYRNLLKAFKDLNKMGFALASYDPNLCQEKTREVDKKYHSYFDVLFVKQS